MDIETKYGDIKVVESSKRFEKVVKLIRNERPLLLDTETTGVGPDRGLRMIQLGSPKKGAPVYVLKADSHWMGRAAELLLRRTAPIVAHNAGFDIVSISLRFPESDGYDWLARLAAYDAIWCTSTAHSLQPGGEWYGAKLSKLAAPTVDNDPEAAWIAFARNKGWAQAEMYRKTPLSNPQYIHYAGHDIFQLREVFAKYEHMFTGKLAEWVSDECIVDVGYEMMTNRGLLLDIPRAADTVERMSGEFDSLMTKLHKHGIPSPMASKTDEKQVGVGAALVNLGARLDRVDKNGHVLANKKELEGIITPDKAFKLATNVLAARSKMTDRASVRKMIELARPVSDHPDVGLLHPTLRRIGAITGRSSCSGPNIQQLNKHVGDPEVRRSIRAFIGHCLLASDYDGIEVRVLAELSGDPALAKMLNDGTDVHGAVAAQVFGRDFTPLQRHRSKTANFAMLYGATNGSMARQTGMKVSDAARLRQQWNTLYPRAGKRMKAWATEAERKHLVELPCGWKIPLHERFYAASNYQIQGTAAFIFRKGMRNLIEANLWRYSVMVVHDEDIMSVPGTRKEVKRIAKEVQHHMTIPGDHVTFTVGSDIYPQNWNLT